MKTKAFTLLVSALLFSVSLFAQDREPAPISFEKISDNLYQILGGRGASGGLFIGNNEVLVIDSKMDKASVEGIYKAVAEITDKPITTLVNTHSDGDHVNGNIYFDKSVRIIAHENCRKEFFHPQRNGDPSTWDDDENKPYVPQITFTDQLNIHLGNKTAQLYYFGVGHTTGDAVVYFPEEKTAFIGDQVFWGRPQLIHSYKGGNSFEHVKTTEKILSLDAEKFCSGHSEIKSREDLKQHLIEIKAFQEKVKSLVAQGKSLNETKAVFSENEARLVESVYNEIKAM